MASRDEVLGVEGSKKAFEFMTVQGAVGSYAAAQIDAEGANGFYGLDNLLAQCPVVGASGASEDLDRAIGVPLSSNRAST